MLYIPVAGTWSRKMHDHIFSWYRVNSPFDRLVSAMGYQRVDQNGDPNKPDRGYWSGEINGLMLQRFFWWRNNHPAWKTGGETLRKFLLSRGKDFENGVTLFLHSHGGQVGAYALEKLTLSIARQIPIHVVTCDMPVRKDMREVYLSAAEKVETWRHLYSERGWKSKMRWLGDGQIFYNPRVLSVANVNIEVKGGHSGYLSDPAFIDQWRDILQVQK